MSRRFSKRSCGIFLLLTLFLLPIGPAGARSQAATSVTISTVPELEGIVFYIGDQRVVTGEDGTAKTTLPVAGVYELETSERRKLGTEVRIAFGGWSDGGEEPRRSIDVGGPTAIEAGYDVDYLIEESYVDASGSAIASDRLSSVTVSDDAGESHSWPAPSPGVAGPTAVVWERHPPGTQWLRATDVSLSDGNLSAKEMSYELEAVVVDGESMTPASRTLPLEPGAEWSMAVAPAPWWSGSWLWIAAALASVLLVLLMARLRRRVSSPTKPTPARLRRTPETRRSSEFVRIALRNGRTVEGWRMTSADAASPAIIIDVSAVTSDGQPVPSTPIDSFVLKTQILSYETLESPLPESRLQGARRVNPPVSS
jgi:hypothetical protein